MEPESTHLIFIAYQVKGFFVVDLVCFLVLVLVCLFLAFQFSVLVHLDAL